MSDTENEGGLYECVAKDCKVKPKSLRKHIDEAHGGEVSCSYEDCVATLKSTSIYRHINEFHKKKGGKEPCLRCGKEMLKRNLPDHIKRCEKDGTKNFPCTVENCKLVFAMKRDLLNHVDVVHESPSTLCPIKDCNSLVRRRALVRHVKAMHINAKETCNHCKKEISYGNLTKHVERCLSDGKRKFSCTFPDCKSMFTTNINRLHHERQRHQSIIRCPRDNCRLFLHPRSLYKHMKQFHDKITSRCQFCHRDFNFDYLKRHEKICPQK